MRAHPSLSVSLLPLCPALASAQTVQRQEGRARAANGSTLLYRCANGSAFARKWMTPQAARRVQPLVKTCAG